jgi:hypothetical protein
MEDQGLLADFEAVFTATDYWHGPLKGVASYGGKPHFYERIFDHASNDYSELFHLTPIDPQTFELAMEDWHIWRRWEFAYHTGETKFDTHPALPAESLRHAELGGILKARLVTDPRKAVVRTGEFVASGSQKLPKGVGRPLRVKWGSP